MHWILITLMIVAGYSASAASANPPTRSLSLIKQGVLASLDEKQAESQVSAQRSLLLSAQRNVSLQQNVLKGLISDSLSAWADINIQPAGALNALPTKPSRGETWSRGMAHRPDLLKAREDVERLGYIVRYDRNQLFPQLDAVGSYGRGSSAPEFSGAFDQMRRGSSPFHSYGLQLSIPREGAVLDRHKLTVDIR